MKIKITKKQKIILVTTASIGLLGISTSIATPIAVLNARNNHSQFQNSYSKFSVLTKGQNIKISKNVLDNYTPDFSSFVGISGHSNLFANSNSAQNLTNKLSKNESSSKLTAIQKAKLVEIMKSTYSHFQEDGYSSNYMYEMMSKYHVNKDDTQKIEQSIQEDKSSKTPKNTKKQTSNSKIDQSTGNQIIAKQKNVINDPESTSLIQQIGSLSIAGEQQIQGFVSNTVANEVQNLSNYNNDLYNIAVASSVATAISAAAAVAYWACAWFFGITVPDAIAATAAAATDGLSTAALWIEYNDMHSELSSIMNAASTAATILDNGKEWPDELDDISRDISWIKGDYDFDFSESRAVRSTLFTEEAVSDASMWAVPALGALSIIQTLFDLGLFVATASYQTAFGSAIAATLKIIYEAL